MLASVVVAIVRCYRKQLKKKDQEAKELTNSFELCAAGNDEVDAICSDDLPRPPPTWTNTTSRMPTLQPTNHNEYVTMASADV